MSLPSDFPRPTKHAFVEQTGTDECEECGMPELFGGLHPQPQVVVVEVDPPIMCPACSHTAHSTPCQWWSWAPSAKPCRCNERAA